MSLIIWNSYEYQKEEWGELKDSDFKQYHLDNNCLSEWLYFMCNINVCGFTKIKTT